MTDGLIILASLFLFSQAKPEYRLISFSVLLYLVISDVLYNYFFIDFRYGDPIDKTDGNKWALYMFYNIINLSILLRLDYLNSHNAIKLLITANILLNIPMSMYFVTIEQFQYMYNIYYYPALTIAILCLFYMAVISEFGNYIKSRTIFMDNNNPIINYLSNRTCVFKFGQENRRKT